MESFKLNMSSLPELFTICKLNSKHKIPDWATKSDFWAITRTPDELSVVCPQENAPAELVQESNWRCLKIHGPLDFALTGVLASLTAPLAEAGTSVFAISTYETDYLLVKADKLRQAIQILRQRGHQIRAS